MRALRFVLAVFALSVLTDCEKPKPKPEMLGDTPDSKIILGKWSGEYLGVYPHFEFRRDAISTATNSLNDVQISGRKLEVRGVHGHTIDVHWTHEYAYDNSSHKGSWREPTGNVDYSYDFQIDDGKLKLRASTMDPKDAMVLTRE